MAQRTSQQGPQQRLNGPLNKALSNGLQDLFPKPLATVFNSSNGSGFFSSSIHLTWSILNGINSFLFLGLRLGYSYVRSTSVGGLDGYRRRRGWIWWY